MNQAFTSICTRRSNIFYLESVIEKGVDERRHLIDFGKLQDQQEMGAYELVTTTDFIVIVKSNAFMVLPKNAKKPKKYWFGVSDNPSTTKCSLKRSYTHYHHWLQIKEGQLLPSENLESLDLNLTNGEIHFISPLQKNKKQGDVDIHILADYMVFLCDKGLRILVLPITSCNTQNVFEVETKSAFNSGLYKSTKVINKWISFPEGSKWFISNKKLTCLFDI